MRFFDNVKWVRNLPGLWPSTCRQTFIISITNWYHLSAQKEVRYGKVGYKMENGIRNSSNIVAIVDGWKSKTDNISANKILIMWENVAVYYLILDRWRLYLVKSDSNLLRKKRDE